MSKLTYKSAGVDLELYDQAMQRLPLLMQRTHSSRVMELKGGFAGLFRLQGDTPAQQYEDPVLVSGSDGVGTKIKVAIDANRFDSIGIDLVAMCVNDCLCLGAEPLFFLDYLALAKDDPELVTELVAGVSEGCLQSGAALLGGETAIMPGLYQEGEFDMAGFCVGVVERDRMIDGSRISAGDVVLGIASNGFHSNGYSLIRKAVFEHAGLEIDQTIPELNQTVAEALLKPTQIYAQPVVAILNQIEWEQITGLAHITGGGLAENITRILPEGVSIQIDQQSWPKPMLFNWLQQLGQIESEEMYRVFNMGIGFVMLIKPGVFTSIQQLLSESQLECWEIGRVEQGDGTVRII